VFSNLDIVKLAGGVPRKAVTTDTIVMVSDGFLSISLTNAAPQVDQPKISAIEIKLVVPTQDLLINCGGNEYAEFSGERVWLADQYFLGGASYRDDSSPIDGTQDDEVRTAFIDLLPLAQYKKLTFF